MASSFLQSISGGRHKKCGGASSGVGETDAAMMAEPQVFSYERHFGSVGLGQIVNIIDDKTLDESEKKEAAGGGRDRGGSAGGGDGTGVQVT
jgi:hypothetical protein